MNRIQSLATCSLMPMLALSSLATAGDGGSVADRLEQMQAELERLRDDNRAMRTELEELRLANTDNWLTERRAEEIRSIVTDVLADAELRSSLLGDGLMAGWRDGFFLASADGRFMLRLEGQMQFRYVYSYHDTSPSPFGQIPPEQQRHARGFENTRTRLAFRGHLFDRNLTYLIRGEFQRDRAAIPQGGGFSLVDAWMRYHFNDEWSVRAGQFKLPFTREQLVFSGHQLAVERSLVDTNLNIGRSQGVELTYADNIHRFAVAYHDGGEDNLGQFGTVATGQNLGQAIGGYTPGNSPRSTAALAQTVEYAATARYELLLAGTWEQFEDFTSPMGEDFALMLGIAGHVQRDQTTGQPGGLRRHTRWAAYTADVSVEFGGANLYGAFTHHYIDSPVDNINIFGVVAQGGFYVTPKWEAFARYEWGHWRLDLADFEDMHILTVGANYYLDGHDAKWSTDIGVGLTQIDTSWTIPVGGAPGWRTDPDGSRPQIVLRTQFQLLF